MRNISEPGIYEGLSDADYQQDCCVEISLRSSTAYKLVERGKTPAAVAYEEPRLNPDYVREQKRHFDIGSACHALLFGKGKAIELIAGYDYSKNEKHGGAKAGEKQELRDAAYASGKIPLLIHEAKQVRDMVARAQEQIQRLIDHGTIISNPFNPDESEKVLVCRLQGVLCRCMMDGLTIDGDTLSEFKTEGQSAAKENWMWKARKFGYVFRLAFYRRCLEELKIAYSPSVHVFVQESFPPYLLAFYRIDDEFIAQEDQRVGKALKIWRRCLETNEWPGYPLDGFDLDLTDKEKTETLGPVSASGGGHIPSENMPDEAFTGITFKR
jgi:hypothetical protein